MEGLFDRVGERVKDTLFVFGLKEVGGPELLDLHEWLQQEDFEDFPLPFPVPDLGPHDMRRTGWIWDVHSEGQLVRFAADVYGNACQAYEEMADTWLSSFQWALGQNTVRPFGVLGTVNFDRPDEIGFEYVRVPISALEVALSSRSDLLAASNGKAAVRVRDSDAEAGWWEGPDALHQLRGLADQYATGKGPFHSLVHTKTRLDTGKARPASNVAANWMFGDLQRIHLAEGTFPQLR